MASTFIKLPAVSGGGGGGAVDSFNGRTGVVVSQSGDYSAGIVSNVPAGSIAATTVQAAINELDTEKQAVITGAASTVVSANLTASRAVISNASGKITTTAVTHTELDYVGGVTSSIQTQLDAKQAADADLTAIAAISSNGLIARTGAGTAAARTLTAGSAAVSVTNGDGVSGNPTVDLPDSGASAATYGSASETVTAAVNAKGVITSIVSQLISIVSTQISDFTTAARTAVVQNALFPASTVKAPSVDAVTTALASVLTNPMTTNGDMIYYDTGNQRLPIGTVNQLLSVTPGGLPFWRDENLGQDFGDGYLGNATISGLLTLSAPAYYDVLTIDAGCQIITSGYPIYCKTLDLSNAPTGAIRWNGNNGGSATTQTGGTSGAALSTQVLGGATAGSAGATATTGAGAQSAAPTNASPGNGGSGGLSGASGAGINAGAAAATGGSALSRTTFGRLEQYFIRGISQIIGGAGGRGGSSGGGDGAVVGNSRGGGGAGGGAGVIAIYADEIITSVSTASGVIQANGGNGGNGGSAAAINVGAGGGGGGGGGGYVFLAYNRKTGPVVSSLIQAIGGTGGNGGNAQTGGTGGGGGGGALSGYIDVIDFGNLIGTHVGGVAGSAGSASSGQTGGTGGAGGSVSVSL